MTVMSESLPVTQKILKWLGREGFQAFSHNLTVTHLLLWDGLKCR